MTRSVGTRLGGIVPLSMTLPGTVERRDVPGLMIEEKDPFLICTYSLETDIPMRQLAKMIGLPRSGRIPITLKSPGGNSWPEELSIEIVARRLVFEVVCSLKLPSRKRASLMAVSKIANEIQRRQKIQGCWETWTIEGGFLRQQWQISSGVTWREFSKALGIHSSAMLEERHAILRAALEAGKARI